MALTPPLPPLPPLPPFPPFVPPFLTPGQIGDISELKVHLAAKERGWMVFTSMGNSCHYDLILDIGGCLLRVQVKTVQCRSGSFPGVPGIPSVRVAKRDNRPYAPTDFDFLVAVMGSDYWIVPMADIKGRTGLSLGPSCSKYFNRFDLIEKEAEIRLSQAMVGAAYYIDLGLEEEPEGREPEGREPEGREPEGREPEGREPEGVKGGKAA